MTDPIRDAPPAMFDDDRLAGRRLRCDPLICPDCGRTVDPYHPADARIGVHAVVNVTARESIRESFLIVRCDTVARRRADRRDDALDNDDVRSSDMLDE